MHFEKYYTYVLETNGVNQKPLCCSQIKTKDTLKFSMVLINVSIFQSSYSGRERRKYQCAWPKFRQIKT